MGMAFADVQQARVPIRLFLHVVMCAKPSMLCPHALCSAHVSLDLADVPLFLVARPARQSKP